MLILNICQPNQPQPPIPAKPPTNVPPLQGVGGLGATSTMQRSRTHFFLALFALIASFRASGQATLPPDMILVQGGTFTMGCTAEQTPDCYSDESPAHEVTLTDFYMGKYEVTQGQWQSLTGYTQAQMMSFSINQTLYGVGATHPIYYVSWYDAAVFCNQLSEQQGYTPCYYSDAAYTQIYGKNGSTYSLPITGTVFWKPLSNGYRLPTEAEWEYAARGGALSQGYKYAGTSSLGNLKNYCNYKNAGDGYDNYTSPVGSFLPNELGLYDLSGNLWEWCYDWYSDTYYSSPPPPCAPTGPGTGSFRVLRGGSWASVVIALRVAYRYGAFTPAYRNGGDLGFRLCRTP